MSQRLWICRFLPVKVIRRKVFFTGAIFLVCFLYLNFFALQSNILDIDQDVTNPYYYKFELVSPSTVPKETNTKDFFLIILVNSGSRGSQYRDRRKGIREFWANKTSCENLNAQYDWRLVFMLGKSRTTNDDVQNIKEAEEHNDMLIGNIDDHYYNNTIKAYMDFLWVFKTHPHAKYIFKVDDDVYVRIPAVIDYLVKNNFPTRFYGGRLRVKSLVHRTAGGKWSISRKYYDKYYWPPFATGAFILFSNDLTPGLLNHVTIRKPVQTDDAYIGVVMNDLKVTAIEISSFIVERDTTKRIQEYDNCEFLSFDAFGHDIFYTNVKMIHRRLENLCQKNKAIMNHSCPQNFIIFFLRGLRLVFKNLLDY